MQDFSLENLICHRDNLENVLDNLKEGIIAHDMNRRIFFLMQKPNGSPVIGVKRFWVGTVMKPLAARFAGSAAPFVKILQNCPTNPSTP